MKLETIYTDVLRIETALKDNYTAAAVHILEEIRAKLEAAFRAETNARSGKKEIEAAALRILKSADDFRPVLKKAYKTADGVAVCDGYRAIIFNESDAPELPTNDPAAPYPDITSILKNAAENLDPLTLPTLSDLIAYIKTEKARRKAAKDKTPIFYHFDGVAVNAEYLRDVMQALPEASATASRFHRDTRPLYFKAANGCGLLMPVRIRKEDGANV